MRFLILLYFPFLFVACSHTIEFRASHFATPVVSASPWQGQVSLVSAGYTKVSVINDITVSPPSRSAPRINESISPSDLLLVGVLGVDLSLSVLSGLDFYIENSLFGIRYQILNSGDHENVWVLPAGPIPHNPSELLNSLSLDALFTELKERFDVIIVDTAPLILVSDAETMLKPTDTVVFVTRQKHTPKMVFKDALLKIQRLGITDINIVFNGVRTKGFGYYYMYGDYQYSYMYSYGGYFENEGIPSVNGKKWYSRLLSRMFKFKKRT